MVAAVDQLEAAALGIDPKRRYCMVRLRYHAAGV